MTESVNKRRAGGLLDTTVRRLGNERISAADKVEALKGGWHLACSFEIDEGKVGIGGSGSKKGKKLPVLGSDESQRALVLAPFN